jgi:gamma-glutamylcyclotransferase (GGCT)/AIG2-like uncharacterized protein YtfP
MKYFAYGSNCNAPVMARKGVEFTSRQFAVLPGYQLRFNKKAMREKLPAGIGFANINEDPEASVEGILYEILDEHLDALDQSERYPDHYTRIDVTVTTRDGATVACVAYQAQPDKVEEGLRPSRNYLNHILAAKDFLSWQYYDALEKSQTYEGECACCLKHHEVIFIREGDRLHMLCQPCREARSMWGDARGRPLTIPETEAVMTQLVQPSDGFSSVQELIEEAITTRIIDP